MKKSLVTCLFITLVLPTFAATLSRSINFIALSGNQMPGTSANYASFAPPLIYNHHVAYLSSSRLQGPGIFSNLTGKIQPAAYYNTNLPGKNDSFSSFTPSGYYESSPNKHDELSLWRNRIAFLGNDYSDQGGVYLYTAADGITPVATFNMQLPKSTLHFKSFAYPTALANNGIAFLAYTSNQQTGLYKKNSPGTIVPLVQAGAPMPNDIKKKMTNITDYSFSRDVTHPNQFVFTAQGQDKTVGLFWVKNETHVQMIANQNTQIPGDSVGFFTGFNGLSFDAKTNRTAFIGHGILGQADIFIYANGRIFEVAGQETLIPGGIGHFQSFRNPNLSGDIMVFEATGRFNQQGVFLYTTTGNIYKVLTANDRVNGKTVRSVKISHNAFNYNHIAALVTFKDNSSGIFLITFSSKLNL
jgi:hypothetical protein